MNYREHNREQEAVWKAFWAGNPIRVPVLAGVSSNWAIQDKRFNTRQLSFQEYTEDPRLMFDVQVAFAKFVKEQVVFDQEMGPDAPFTIEVDLQNYHESAWLGAPVKFNGTLVPSATPWLTDDNRNEIFDRGIPGPFDGVYAMCRDYYEKFHEFKKEEPRVKKVMVPCQWTDGPFTLACCLRGVDNFCIDLLEEPEYAQELLSFLTEAVISRVKAWRKYMGEEEIQGGYGFADDSVAMLSEKMYRELVLPHHKHLVSALSSRMSTGIHLCGNATHLFPTIEKELGCGSFDTGFPVDFPKLLSTLSPKTIVRGGPKASLFLTGTADDVYRESVRILKEAMPFSRRFILREGNNMPPNVSLDTIEAMYRAAREHPYE